MSRPLKNIAHDMLHSDLLSLITCESASEYSFLFLNLMVAWLGSKPKGITVAISYPWILIRVY
jgi:hypothetical protein